jgi:hypothetical protein
MQPRGVRRITGAPLPRMVPVPVLEGEAACGDSCADDDAGAVRGRGAAPAELGLRLRELQGRVR